MRGLPAILPREHHRLDRDAVALRHDDCHVRRIYRNHRGRTSIPQSPWLKAQLKKPANEELRSIAGRTHLRWVGGRTGIILTEGH
jgi:hypothetical protein